MLGRVTMPVLWLWIGWGNAGESSGFGRAGFVAGLEEQIEVNFGSSFANPRLT